MHNFALLLFVLSAIWPSSNAVAGDRPDRTPSTRKPMSACVSRISEAAEAKVISAIENRLPVRYKIQSVVRNQPLPEWQSLVNAATGITIVDSRDPDNPIVVRSIWLVPLDWVGIKIPGTPAQRKWISAGGWSTNGEIKTTSYSYAQRQMQWKDKGVWATAVSIFGNSELVHAQKHFAGREGALDKEVAYLIRDLPKKQYWSAFSSLLHLGVPAQKFYLDNWRGRKYGNDRAATVRVLVQFRGKDRLRVIREAFVDKHASVRCAAIQALSQLPNDQRRRFDKSVTHCVKDESGKVQYVVAEALGTYPVEMARPLLLELLRKKDARWQTPYSALKSLKKLGVKVGRNDIVSLLREMNGVLRQEVMRAAGEVGEPEFTSTLLELALEYGVLDLGTPKGHRHPDPGIPWNFVEAAYRNANLRGKIHDGERLGILTAKQSVKPNETVYVFHVREAVNAKKTLLLAGPLPVNDYVDGDVVDSSDQIFCYSGFARKGPGISTNYDVTKYTFPTPGIHRIQWREGDLRSNIVEIRVREKDPR